MVSLILVVCLTATPDVCREERPPMDVLSGASCMIQGQQLASQWLMSIRNGRCGDGNVNLVPRKKRPNPAAPQVPLTTGIHRRNFSRLEDRSLDKVRPTGRLREYCALHPRP
jgi:hypothetical protein